MLHREHTPRNAPLTRKQRPHLHVAGAKFSGSERQLHISDIYGSHLETLPVVNYAAFGHIHRPQPLPGSLVMGTYAGSPIQLDFGELDEEKSVVVVEARPQMPSRIERHPLSGRELAFRATGAVDGGLLGVDWSRVAEVARAFLSSIDTHEWQPTLAFDGARPLDFAPYVLTHLEARGARITRFDEISAAMDAFYAGLAEAGPVRRGDPLAAERRALLTPLVRAIETTERRNAALEHQLENGHALREPLRWAGEMILTHQAALAPGATELAVGDQHIELDGSLSASDNAQAYFARYRKAREAEERVPRLLEEGRQQALYLADLRTLVELADGMDSVRALRREVGVASGNTAVVETKAPRRGSKSKTSTSTRAGAHRRVSLGDGWEVLVGASAAGNAAVTFDLAQPDDLWLHARGVPGAHVILRTTGSTPPDSIVERAAELAAWHSAARTAGAAEVDIASKRYVKKIPNAPPGLVRYSNERTVRVTPHA